MRRSLPLLMALSFLGAELPLFAEDRAVREAQQALREMGSYSGEVDGVSTAEFRSAVRRFQQQRGLETTGELTGSTREALREASKSEKGNTLVAVAPERASVETAAPMVRAPEPTVIPPSPVPQSQAVVRGDRAFLESDDSELEPEEAPVSRRETVVYEREEERPDDDGNASEPVFAGSYYEDADPREQADVLRRVESILRRHGLLESDPDLSPDALLEEALFRFQSAEGIRLTGLLDDQTLASMRLLPQQRASREEWGSRREERQVEVFRGRVPRSSSEPYPNAVRGIPLN